MQKHVNLVRSRQELSNEYLFAKFGVDTAENEHLKVHLIIQPWDLIFTELPRQQGRNDPPQSGLGSQAGAKRGTRNILSATSHSFVVLP